MGASEDHAAFAACEAKLAEMRAHSQALAEVESIAKEALLKVWQVAEPLGEAAIRALVQGLAQSLAAQAEARLGGGR